ncbi:MAG: hypothetical protein OJF49_001722 [Ktedonobacterales bacterium]|jgi:predicted nucleotidyltransferase|nr:MAG: hypothetical protein OJF49_001722 [Ktedonobacterales bacterium]
MASNSHMGNHLNQPDTASDTILVDEASLPLISWLDPDTMAYLRRVIALIAQQAPDALAAILFGSVARHEERPLTDPHPSDVDVLVLFAPVGDQESLTSEQHAMLSWAVVQAYNAYPGTPREVQVLGALTHFAHWDESLVEHVARDGILLWARRPLPTALHPVEERW